MVVALPFELWKNEGVVGLVFDVISGAIYCDDFAEVSVKIAQILNETSISPHHRLPSKHSSEEHHFWIYFHYCAHYHWLVLLGKNNYFVFLCQSHEHIL